jgi:hypothetical protein
LPVAETEFASVDLGTLGHQSPQRAGPGSTSWPEACCRTAASTMSAASNTSSVPAS